MEEREGESGDGRDSWCNTSVFVMILLRKIAKYQSSR